MDDGSPTLEVGFAIDTGGSFAALTQLGAMMDSVEAKILREAKSIEQATGGMLNLGSATTSIAAFASTTSAAFLKAEQSAERMTARLVEQTATFGMTRAAAAAWRAEQAGATAAADELRSAEAALNALRAKAVASTEAEAAAVRDAEAAYRAFEQAAKQNMAAYNSQQAAIAAQEEAQAIRSATLAYQMFNAVAKQKMAAYDSGQAAQLEREAVAARNAADAQARLAATVQASAAAQEADAVAAERMRAATDPLYASTKRLNDQIAESTRLYYSGATAKAEYERQQGVLNGQLVAETAALGKSTSAHGAHAAATGISRAGTMELTHVIKASVDQIAAGAPPTQILFQHIAQLGQIATMTEGGVWGLTKALGGMVATVLPIVGPLAIVAGVAFAAFKQFQGQVKDSGELTRYRDGLGLTHKEMLELSDGVDKAGDKIKHLSDVTITAGDMMAGLWDAVKASAHNDTFDSIWSKMKGGAGSAFSWILNAWDVTAAGISAGIYGTFNAVKLVWSNFPAVFGDLFVQGANAAIGALNKLVRFGVEALNGVISQANRLPGVNIAQVAAPQIALLENMNAGAAARMGKATAAGFTGAFHTARDENAALWADAGKRAIQHNKDRQKEQADALKANRAPTKPKVDHNALNSEAVEAQIKNLYKLADAYGVSDAAALIAEAREKAESKAIKARADVEAAVAQQIRLSVAQRVADAAKATASLTNQAVAQEAVNAQVAAGIVPAAQAAQVLQDRMALLPLLAAQEAARSTGDTVGYAKATAGLSALTAAQLRDNAAKRAAQFLSDQSAADNQLDQLRLEASLVGATDQARVHALATLKATQEAQAKFTDPAQQAAYVAKQVQIADQTQANTLAQDAYNASLTFTADKWDIIAGKVQSAAQGMADAFGNVGKAIGDVASTYASYEASRARLGAEHDEAVRKAGTNEQALAIANQRFALQSAGAQTAAYGDMIGAAKGFFKEGTAGYAALGAAEKVYRLAQLAMSVASMVQDVRETITHVTGSAARTAANATEGVSAQAKLPFPLNLVAMTATAAALVAAGISIFAGSGSGSATPAPTSSEDMQKAAGTGTVLGSANDHSASIAHSLDLVAKNTNGLLAFSNPMLAALKSIDASIGAMTATVARELKVSGSLGDTSKLGLGASGSAGFLGLFSSSTTRTLYDAGITLAATTVGNIVANGISGQTYQIVEQVKKSSGFLGIGGGTKTTYSTTTGALPSDITASIQSVIGALENGIVAAASSMGVNGAKAMLDNFSVSIGKLSFNGLDAQGIQDELNAVFSSVGDQMVEAILPEVARFQKAGEGLFETLERVASTTVAVDAEFRKLGRSSAAMSIDVDMGVASMFDSVSDFTTAADAYFKTFYSVSDQVAAQTADMQQVFASLNLTMPSTLAGFRSLVDAQDLTSAAGQQTYATLLKIAPAFAELQQTMNGAKSAADALSERQGLLNQLWQLQGDTASIRAAQLATLDASNRDLQQQIYATQDAQDAAKAAADLASAWKTVGDSILDEINRIRGLSDTTGSGSFATLMGQFNAATTAARAGDQTVAKTLPALSQALLTAAASAATSRQELDRVQSQTAASLQATYDVIGTLAATPAASTATSNAALLAAAATSQASTTPSTAANDDMASAIEALRQEVTQLRQDLNTGNATIAGNTGKMAKILDASSQASGGTAISVAAAA